MLNVDFDSISLRIQSIIAEMWESENIPSEWKVGKIVERKTSKCAPTGQEWRY